jgi:copper(I)-binding protein
MKKVFGLLLLLVLVLTACAPAAGSGEPALSQNGIEIFDPWVRAAAMKAETGDDMHSGGAVTGAFMLLKNTTDQADTLLGASSDVAEMVQIHETTMSGGVMSMAEVAGVEIPAGGLAELKPGGYHVMLIGLKRELKEGETIPLVLFFENAGEVSIQVPVKMP